MRNSVLIGLLIFLLSACAKDNAILWSSAKNVDLIFVPTERASEFIYPKTGNGDNLTPAPADVVRDSTDRTASEFNVADTCNPTPYTAAQGKPAFAFLIPIAVAIGVDLILNQINSSMAAEIAKYDAGFSAVNSVQFYKMSKSGGLSLRGGNVVPEYSCIRFVRYEKSEKAGQPASIVFDLVASLNLEKSPESIRDESPGASQKSDAEKIKDEYPVLNPSDVFRITPLRLYYLKSVAESESQDKQGESYKKISLSINLLGNSIWRQRNKGEMSQIFSGTLLTITCNLDPDGKKAAVWYSDAVASQSYSALNEKACVVQSPQGTTTGSSVKGAIIGPLPSYSVDPKDGSPSGGGAFVLTATAAEVGAPSKVLCAFAKGLKDEQGAMQSAFLTAIDEKASGKSTSVTPGAAGGGGGGGGGGASTVSTGPCGP